MDSPTTPRSLRLYFAAKVPLAGPRWHLRPGVSESRPSSGPRGSPNCTSVALAVALHRKVARVGPPRMFGSRHRVQPGTCTVYWKVIFHIITAAGRIWPWTKMPQSLAQCRDRKKATSSRWTKWAACIIATSGWRPENVDLPTHQAALPAGVADHSNLKISKRCSRQRSRLKLIKGKPTPQNHSPLPCLAA